MSQPVPIPLSLMHRKAYVCTSAVLLERNPWLAQLDKALRSLSASQKALALYGLVSLAFPRACICCCGLLRSLVAAPVRINYSPCCFDSQPQLLWWQVCDEAILELNSIWFYFHQRPWRMRLFWQQKHVAVYLYVH